MIQEIFLSLLSGLCLLFGLDPGNLFFFTDKMDSSLNSGLTAACWAGILNALILLWLKYKKELVDKNLLPYLALPPLFYQILCAPYFNVWIHDLRIFTWIFAGSLALGYFLLTVKLANEKSKLLVLFLLAYASQIPGSVSLLLLILLLRNNKTPVISSVILVFVSLLPAVVWRLFSSGYAFYESSESAPLLLIISGYLLACGGIYIAAVLLMKIFKAEKFKLLLNTGLTGAIFLLFLTSRYGGNLSGEKVYQYSFPTMGTSCEITIWTNDSTNAGSAVKEVQKLVEGIEAALSTYQEESEITQMNKTAFYEPFKCSDVLWENLKLAEYAYSISDGGFDVTVGPLVKLWSIKKKRSQLPGDDEIKETLKKVGFNKIKLDEENKTVKFEVDGLQVDFGGMTKGWAVDKAAQKMLEMGEQKFILNLGGNLYCSQDLPSGRESYTVGIKDPKYPGKLCSKVNLVNQAVATSGNYEQFIVIDGKRYTHIIDPRTGYPVDGVDAVTVISPSATLSDILSTAVFVEGKGHIQKLREKGLKDLHILFIDINEQGEDLILKDGLFQEAEIKIH